jgi:hypothetical protein
VCENTPTRNYSGASPYEQEDLYQTLRRRASICSGHAPSGLGGTVETRDANKIAAMKILDLHVLPSLRKSCRQFAPQAIFSWDGTGFKPSLWSLVYPSLRKSCRQFAPQAIFSWDGTGFKPSLWSLVSRKALTPLLQANHER